MSIKTVTARARASFHITSKALNGKGSDSTLTTEEDGAMTASPRQFDPSGFSLAPGARRVEKPWGYEVLLSPPDAPYTSKLIHVRAGKRLSLQIHDVKVETQTLVAGRGILVLEGPDGTLHDVPMEPGVGYHVAVGQRHRLCAAPDEDATVFEASTPEVGTTYRLEDDYARPDETETLRQAERSKEPSSG